ncbi:MAG: serine/threonine protein phosphatase [Sphingomonas sp. 28-62-20]|uniref:metallophosphoesterase family protein n=1 Tax=Sphingomonas sp. 28-62-20 TaxID=1970433 RepID=UPI000BD4F9A6|nr:MAG: serine/threonine protein phosphatase [Sphingomonas sp. 28-62-20]
MGLFGKLFQGRSAPAAFSTPPNTRAYAIGDVHGRLDLLSELLTKIDKDRQQRPTSRDYTIFLGDLIDRGPQSAEVIDYLLRARSTLNQPIFLAGNHEEMLLRILRHDGRQLAEWLNYGGRQCVESYGIDAAALLHISPEAAQQRLRAAIPAAHLDFIASFADSFRLGDYLFVHAGIRPGIAVEEQTIADLHWIREDFLDSPARYPFMVIHGHTISSGPDEQHNRIGIDTGAYSSGILTALCIEGTERRYITT